MEAYVLSSCSQVAPEQSQTRYSTSNLILLYLHLVSCGIFTLEGGWNSTLFRVHVLGTISRKLVLSDAETVSSRVL